MKEGKHSTYSLNSIVKEIEKSKGSVENS